MRTSPVLAALLCCTAPSGVRAQTGAANTDICGNPETPPELIGGLDSLRAVMRWPTQDDIVCTVVVGFTVETDGSTSHPEIRRACRQDLDAAALDAVGIARFRPGMISMEPVAMRAILPFRFKGLGGSD